MLPREELYELETLYVPVLLVLLSFLVGLPTIVAPTEPSYKISCVAVNVITLSSAL